MKSKKRWRPKHGQKFWTIDYDGTPLDYYPAAYYSRREFSAFGVYRTKREAQAMIKKIRAFVSREIGEV